MTGYSTPQQSLMVSVKQLESDVLRLLAPVDVTDMTTSQQQLIRQLKHALVDARLEIRDYELAETLAEQQHNVREAKRYLQTVEALIADDTLHVFGPADVAQLTAHIGQISGKMV